jgi:hypothetical protein
MGDRPDGPATCCTLTYNWSTDLDNPSANQMHFPEEQIMIKVPEIILIESHCSLSYLEISWQLLTNSLSEVVKTAQEADKTVTGYHSIRSIPSFPLDISWSDDGMLLEHGRVYVPKLVRYDVLKQYHNLPTSDHPRIW